MMSTIGPELPPHLAAKRKRQQEEPIDQPVSTRSRSTSSSSGAGAKRRCIIGPSLPPAALNEKPLNDPDSNAGTDSDSDSDLGPAPPPASGCLDQPAGLQHGNSGMDDMLAKYTVKKPQREEWMLVPPKQDDWTSRVDPTKLRNRKFNTGKGAKAPSQGGSGDNALWTETAEQKRQRLEDEVMGVKKPAQLDQDSKKGGRSEAEARETERRIREYNVGACGSRSRRTIANILCFIGEESKFLTLQ